MGKSDPAYRPGLQVACGKWGSSRHEQSAGEWVGEDLNVPRAQGKSLDLGSLVCSQKALESTISEVSQSGLYPSLPFKGWEVGLCQASGRLCGGRHRKWLEPDRLLMSGLTHYQQGNHRVSAQTSGRHWAAGIFLEGYRQTCPESWAFLSRRSWEASRG